MSFEQAGRAVLADDERLWLAATEKSDQGAAIREELSAEIYGSPLISSRRTDMANSSLSARWIAEARRHEQAADRIFGHCDLDVTAMDEEQMLHLEIARVLRNCANELIGNGAEHSSSSVECPHCHWGLHPTVIEQHIREKH
jgi:hypothetical protein